MIVPILDRWDAGDQPNDVMFNSLNSVIQFLQNPPEGHFTQNAPSQSIPSSSLTAVTFTTAVLDTEATYDAANPMWSLAGGSSKIFIRTRGWYELELFTNWAAQATQTRRFHSIRLNGPTSLECDYVGRMDMRNVAGTSSTKLRSVVDAYFDAGTYIELMAYQDSGSAVTLQDDGTVGQRTSLRLRWYSI